jgi:hypothetical protein
VRFVRPFSLKGAERSFPAGAYRVITDEELIEGISLLAYRRVSTMILVPGGLHGSSVEMLSIDPSATLFRSGCWRSRPPSSGAVSLVVWVRSRRRVGLTADLIPELSFDH